MIYFKLFITFLEIGAGAVLAVDGDILCKGRGAGKNEERKENAEFHEYIRIMSEY